MSNKTVFAIAHRLSTISHMDRIVVMDDGRIIEEGSHTSLLAEKRCICKFLGPPIWWISWCGCCSVNGSPHDHKNAITSPKFWFSAFHWWSCFFFDVVESSYSLFIWFATEVFQQFMIISIPFGEPLSGIVQRCAAYKSVVQAAPAHKSVANGRASL